jgi:hypothetical protein
LMVDLTFDGSTVKCDQPVCSGVQAISGVPLQFVVPAGQDTISLFFIRGRSLSSFLQSLQPSRFQPPCRSSPPASPGWVCSGGAGNGRLSPHSPVVGVPRRSFFRVMFHHGWVALHLGTIS